MKARRKHESHNNEPRIGRPVTDGRRVFKNYEWRGEDIYSFWTKRIIEPIMIHDNLSYMLAEDGKQYDRTRRLLYMQSHPEKFLPEGIEKWIDVLGYEDYFCFNPQNPNQIWSKKYMKFIKLNKNNNRQSQHLLFCASKGRSCDRKTLYVHKIVWQSYFKKTIKRGYVIHHINHDSFDNRIQNMMLLPRYIHSRFEIYYNVYKHKSDFYSATMTKEEIIDRIENFNISDENKQKLIENL